MKKPIILLLMMLVSVLAFGQSTVTGTVILSEEDNTPAVGASIKVQGGTETTFTNVDGEFSIPANPTDNLIISYIGYEPLTVAVDNQSAITITLSSSNLLEDVVVTALGITRKEEAIGYSYDKVSSEDIGKANQDNIVNTLQGQVSGALISSTGGGPGQTSRIVLRGASSFQGDNQPLFVIDGIPIDNSSLTVGGGAVRNISNRASDVNPADIENVTVLKGGAATALYGQRGANGVIVITTKQGKAGETRINFVSTFALEEVNKFPETQKVYTQGFGGNYDPDSFWPSWGPTVEDARAMDPTHPTSIFNNFENAYQTGNKQDYNLSISGGSEAATFLLSGNYVDHEGTLPFSDYKKISARATGNLNVSERFRINASANFINSGGDRVNADGFNERLIYWAPQADVNDYVKPDGTMKGYRNGGDRGNNPVWGARTNKFTDNVNRIIASTVFGYDFTDWLTVNYRIGADHYSDFRKATAPGPQGISGENVFENNGLGYVTETPIKRTSLNSNFYLQVDKDFGDFGITAIGGQEFLHQKYDRVTTSGNELDIFNLFSLNNAKDITTDQFRSEGKILGIYGDVAVDYKDALFLNLTGRNDWDSTLPEQNSNFFYPSVSLSWIATETLSLPEEISYLKIRSSLANVGNGSLTPYVTQTDYFPSGSFPLTNPNGVDINGWTRDNQRGAPDLKPTNTTTFDIGTDVKLFNNRLGVDFTWYKTNTTDQILNIPVTSSSGFSAFVGNLGEVENKGVELQLNGSPIQKDDWGIDMTVNFTSNKGTILDVGNGFEEVFLGSFFGYAGSSASMLLQPGLEWGNIYGRSWLRQGDDPDSPFSSGGPQIIGSDGFPERGDTKILGNSQPDWFGSINTVINWKDFSLTALVDTRQGAQKYNQMGNFFAAFGTAEYTLDRNDFRVFDGVTESGTPNTEEVWLGQGVGPDGVDYGSGYYRNHYRGVTENFVEDADWWRLRNLNLTYNVPKQALGKVFQDASVSLIGYNLLLATDFSGFDPEGIATGNSNADGFTGFNYPNSRSYSLRFNVTPF